jgi:hypothetical protein
MPDLILFISELLVIGTDSVTLLAFKPFLLLVVVADFVVLLVFNSDRSLDLLKFFSMLRRIS